MIRSDLELDLPALVGALRSTPVLHGTALVDSAEQIIAGPTSYQLMDEGFGLHIQNQHWLQPFRYRLIRRNYVTIQFTQSGAYRLHGDGQIRRVRAGSVRLNAMPESVSEFRQATTVRGASIFMEREQLIECFGLRPDLWREEYRAAFSKGGLSPISIEMPLAPEMWLIIDAIINCAFSEPVRSLYLAAKATELLALTVVHFNRLAQCGVVGSMSQPARDQRLIETAALIYRNELGAPPSIDMLSRRIGLNRNKLTQGFQSAFGMTPAEYSRQVRLDWAARRLSEGLDVGQVAAEVGYDSTAAFGRAFRQRYGHAPSRPTSNG